ncbi:MAG TPA: hypothetical protein VF331_06450 [Polyangiales bacterium]
MLQTSPQSTPRATRKGTQALEHTHDLDSLSRLDVDALGRLYALGTPPATVDGLEGHPRGRLLAVAALDHGVVGALVRSLMGAALFPWGGKSFVGKGTSGRGFNRFHFGGRRQLLPFLTRVQASAVDGAPCIALDYDLRDNPGFVRAIQDEVREIQPGLFLGSAMWKAARGPRFILSFALDTRVQALPIGGA